MRSNESRSHQSAGEGKQPWEPLERTFVGNVREVVQGGGGKLSPTGGDMGDPLKPPGAG